MVMAQRVAVVVAEGETEETEETEEGGMMLMGLRRDEWAIRQGGRSGGSVSRHHWDSVVCVVVRGYE